MSFDKLSPEEKIRIIYLLLKDMISVELLTEEEVYTVLEKLEKIFDISDDELQAIITSLEVDGLLEKKDIFLDDKNKKEIEDYIIQLIKGSKNKISSDDLEKLLDYLNEKYPDQRSARHIPNWFYILFSIIYNDSSPIWRLNGKYKNLC